MGVVLTKHQLRDRIDKFNRDPVFVQLRQRAAQLDHFISIDYSGTFHHLCETHGNQLYYTCQLDFKSKREIAIFKEAITQRVMMHLKETEMHIRAAKRKQRDLINQSKFSTILEIKDYV